MPDSAYHEWFCFIMPDVWFNSVLSEAESIWLSLPAHQVNVLLVAGSDSHLEQSE